MYIGSFTPESEDSQDFFNHSCYNAGELSISLNPELHKLHTYLLKFMNLSRLNIIRNSVTAQMLLKHLGEELYAVGGAVRDAVLEREIHDIDYTCPHAPEEIISKLDGIVAKVIPTGLSHQTVTVLPTTDSHPVEITSFRTSNMNPEGGVFLGQSIEEDLSYRDFTINAMALRISDGSLIDPLGGATACKNKIISCVGDARSRFEEDPLRILRLIRFSSTLRMNIEENTWEQAKLLSESLSQVAIERITEEFKKIVCATQVRFGLEQLLEIDFFKTFIPELEKSVDFEQNKFHEKDVFMHTIDVVENVDAELTLRLAALFHDIGKPYTLSVGDDGERHFYQHEHVGADLTRTVMKRMRFSTQQIQDVCTLVDLHMRPISAGDSGLRRILRDVGEDLYLEWRQLKEADTTAVMGTSKELSAEFSEFDARIQKLKNEGSPFQTLELSGEDLIQLGYSPSPLFGEILRFLLEEIMERPEMNTQEKLTDLVKKHFPL